jgi:hypothetical protein
MECTWFAEAVKSAVASGNAKSMVAAGGKGIGWGVNLVGTRSKILKIDKINKFFWARS